MERINNTLFAHWNTDSSGNPVSEQVSETQKVSPIHLCIQLNQIPDDFQSLNVRIENTILSEVFDNDVIGENQYKVDYGDGIIWFNQSRAGATVNIDYYGRGYKTIHASRVTLDNGDLIGVHTLHDLVELNQEAIASINNINQNFEQIIHDITTLSNETISQIEMLANDTEGKVLSHANTAMSKMNDARLQVEDLVWDTQVSIKKLVQQVTDLLEVNKGEVQAQLEAIQNAGVEALQRISAKKAEFEANLQVHLDELEAFANDAKQHIREKRNQAQVSIEEEVSNVGKTSQKAKHTISEKLDEFSALVEQKRQEMLQVIADAMTTVHDLTLIFEGKQLQWNAEFNDSQLERLNLFNETSNSQLTKFEQAQSEREQLFNNKQEQQQCEFEEAESIREEIFEQIKSKVYDENAILNLQTQIDENVDEVVTEDILELVHDEGGNVIGSIGGQKITFYANVLNEQGEAEKRRISEHIIEGRQAIRMGDVEPIDVGQVWFDTSDVHLEDFDFPENIVLEDFKRTIHEIKNKVTNIENATKLEDIYAGGFSSEGTTSLETEGGTVKHVRIKIGQNINLRPLKEGELAYCVDTQKLYIGARLNPLQTTVTNVAIGGSSSGSGGSSEGETGGTLTGDYVELTNNGKKYRVMIGDDGNLKVHESSYYMAEDPDPTYASRFEGLIINRVYGGGQVGSNLAPVSHGFIELYNNNQNNVTMNLKGLSVQYRAKTDAMWKKIELDGYLPPRHSYLIRCAKHSEFTSSQCRLKIEKFDKDWSSLALPSSGFSIYLGVGREALAPSIVNPFDYDGANHQVEGYIDLMGVGGAGTVNSINAYESKKGYYRSILDINIGAQRLDFADTNEAYDDIEPVNYKTCDVNIYRPRCMADGEWDKYYNKIKLNERIPNLLNICFGKEWHTRTFTWQSGVTEIGYIKYRKVGETKWKTKETERELVYHHDQDCTVHRVIIRDLEEGTYEYKCGEEGAWSDESTFEIINHDPTNQHEHLKFMMVADQQGWTETEYDAWKWAVKYIEENESPDDYEWILNAGDISQNANQSYEWRYYYKHPQFTREKPHMVICGNNDLVDKKYSYCFNYYTTIDDAPEISTTSPYPITGCHSWDWGYVHFVAINTNVAEDSNLIVEQMKWIKQDVEKARARTNPPRWFIAIGHHGALTVCRMKSPQQLIPFIEDLGFDLFLCGHHHTYSRSKPVKMNIREQVEAITGKDLYESSGNAIRDAVYGIGYLEESVSAPNPDQTTSAGNADSLSRYVNEREGMYWVMCQATGYKLKSNKDLEKKPTPWWYGWTGEHPYYPSYIMWDISWNEINLKSYGVTGIMEFDHMKGTKGEYEIRKDIQLDELGKIVLDDFTIRHKSLR